MAPMSEGRANRPARLISPDPDVTWTLAHPAKQASPAARLGMATGRGDAASPGCALAGTLIAATSG
jgi:hypothetical protein